MAEKGVGIQGLYDTTIPFPGNICADSKHTCIHKLVNRVRFAQISMLFFFRIVFAVSALFNTSSQNNVSQRYITIKLSQRAGSKHLFKIMDKSNTLYNEMFQSILFCYRKQVYKMIYVE